jgi:hypothetical protein
VDAEATNLAASSGWTANFAVWGTSLSDVWIGDGLHFDGSRWRALPVGTDAARVTGIYGSDPAHYVAAPDAPGLETWDGTRWTLQVQGPVSPLQGESGPQEVHGSAWNDVHVVGLQSRTLHFDGSTWRRVPAPAQADLLTVFARGPTEAYAAGVSPPLGPTSGEPHVVLWRYDGDRWRETESPGAGTVPTVTGDRDLLFFTDGLAVYERDPQGHWDVLLSAEPGRFFCGLFYGGRLVALDCTYGDSDRFSLWVRR